LHPSGGLFLSLFDQLRQAARAQAGPAAARAAAGFLAPSLPYGVKITAWR
jgi:hypothetical protein